MQWVHLFKIGNVSVNMLTKCVYVGFDDVWDH